MDRSTDTPRSPAKQRVRMSPEARRAQLLDAAAQVVVSRGCDALTMESMAEAADASKTLGYAYFKNIDDVMMALYSREVASLTRMLRDAIAAHESFEEKLRAGVGAYLDGMLLKGPLLVALSGGMESGRFGMREGRPFDEALSHLGDLLEAEYALGAERSHAYAVIFGAIATTQAELLWKGVCDRSEVEQTCLTFFLGGMREVTAEGST